MSATKTVGFVVLIGVGIYGVYYILNRKLEAAEGKATSQLDALSAGLKGTVTGIAASLGAGVKALTGGLTKAGTAGTATTAAAAASKFVGPVQVATAGPGPAAAAGTGGIFSGMSTAGIAAGAAVAAFMVYSLFHKLFPGSDPEQEAIERRFQQAVASGEPIFRTVSKAQLKAPVR